ncbi:hypothetical protein C8Q79DRAFT_1011503 [Trametes meyenii]|nr:hypothetical protein C8Q79DRAFT_1011503 [Trametes meyenii]
MDFCPIPIEMCEAIIDAIPLSNEFLTPDERDTLTACALTCRAWKTRAKAILKRRIWFTSSRSLNTFTSALRTSPSGRSAFVRDLLWYPAQNSNTLGEDFHMSKAADLLVMPLPNLRSLDLWSIVIDFNPRILRMRLSFFAGLTRLDLFDCRFDTPRAMLDLIWACPNLESLLLRHYRLRKNALSAGDAIRLSTSRRHLRVCQKLERLCLDVASPTMVLPGDVFGVVLTTLEITVNEFTRDKGFVNVLRDAFPALRNIAIVLRDEDMQTTYEAPSLLYMIATGLTSPARLLTVTLPGYHGFDTATSTGHGPVCCQRIVGVVGDWDDRPLRSLVPSLVELRINLWERREEAEKCYDYMRGVLSDSVDDILTVVCDDFSIPFLEQKITVGSNRNNTNSVT